MAEKEVNFDERKEFLYSAICDATETIRFLDAKIAAIYVAIGISVTLVVKYSDVVYEVYKLYKEVPFHSCVIALSVICYFIATVISVWYGFRTIEAKHNPKVCQNITKNLWFILSEDNTPNIQLNDYYESINNMNCKELLGNLSQELMKVSIIRNNKIYNINRSLICYKCSFIPCIILLIYILYNYTIYAIN